MICSDNSGQATAEFAMVLPLIVGLLALGMEVVSTALDQVAITHLSREVARVAAIGSDSDPMAVSVSDQHVPERLDRSKLDINVRREPEQGGEVAVVLVTYKDSILFPLTKSSIASFKLHAKSVMWVERAP